MKATVFSIFSIILFSISFGIYTDTDAILIAMSAGSGLFLFGKVAWSYSFLQGHGVGMKKRAVIGLFIIMVILALLLGVLIYGSVQMSQELPSAGKNVFIFSVTMAFAYIVSILYWIFYARKAYYYGSEYEARYELKYEKGCSEEEVEEKILKLKEKGILNPNA